MFLRFRDILFLAANKRPNSIALNPGQLEVAENLVLIRGARRPEFNQQLLNGRPVNAGHLHGGAKAVALSQPGNHPDFFFSS
jgi:hypothetical protein